MKSFFRDYLQKMDGGLNNDMQNEEEDFDMDTLRYSYVYVG